MSEQVTQPPESSFHFVLCEHVPENAAEIAQSLQECDVVAFEHVGGSTAERRVLSSALNEYMQGTAEQQGMSIEVAEEVSDGFSLSVAKLLAGSGKQAEIIDVSNKDAAFKTVLQEVAAEERYFSGLANGDPVTNLEALLTERIHTAAASSAEREALMADQLTILADTCPGARIGVVIGASHTGVQHTLSKQFVTDRQFVGSTSYRGESDEGSRALTKYSYPPQIEAIRQRTFDASKKVGEGVLKTALLHDLASIEQGREYSNDELRGLTPQQLDHALQALDEVRSIEAKTR